MSIQSKGRREAKKKLAERARNQAEANPPVKAKVEPHAELRDQHRALLAGIVRRDGEWVLGMDGRIVGSSDSAAQVLMLIRRAQRLHDGQGVPVKLVYSDLLRDEAEMEAAVNGKSLAEYEKQLEEEMAAVRPAVAEQGASQPH